MQKIRQKDFPRIESGKIRKTIIRAICSANKEYCDLTGGAEWISDRGVESYVAGYVARKFKKLVAPAKGNVFLEVSMKEVKAHIDGKKIIGKHGKHLSSRNRIDVVVTDKKNQVKGVIELKRNEFYSHWETDVRRVASIVARAGIDFGCFAAFVYEAKGDNTIDECWKGVRDYAEAVRPAGIRLEEFAVHRSRFESFDGDKCRYGIVGCIFRKSA